LTRGPGTAARLFEVYKVGQRKPQLKELKLYLQSSNIFLDILSFVRIQTLKIDWLDVWNLGYVFGFRRAWYHEKLL
jgi:hypothetical protein